MYQIPKAQYDHHIAGDLREAFELFAGNNYLEVLNTSSADNEYALVGTLIKFDRNDGGFYNTSCLWSHTSADDYSIYDAIAKGEVDVEYYCYDDLNDARRHAAHLLQDVTDDV